MHRLASLLLGTIVIVSAVVVAPFGQAQAAEDGPTELTECTEITEPGHYRVTATLTDRLADRSHADSACIRVAADDVVVDGQGHDVSPGSRYTPFVRVGSSDQRRSNVTVRDLAVDGYRAAAIEFQSVDGGVVENVTLDSNAVGVSVRNATDIRVVDSTIEGRGGGTTSPSRSGVVVTNSNGTVVADTTFERFTNGAAIKVLHGATDTTVRDNEIRGCVACSDRVDFDRAPIYDLGTGVIVDDAVGTTVRNNAIQNKGYGVRLAGSPDRTTVHENDFENTGDGVRVATAGPPGEKPNARSLVANNTVENSAVAVRVLTTHRPLVVRGNTIVDSQYGVYLPTVDTCPPGVDGRDEITVGHNDFLNTSEYAVLNERSTTVNATANYWGAASGPASGTDSDAPLADPVTGALADGSGGAVSEDPENAGVANVRFDPWLSQPVTNETG